MARSIVFPACNLQALRGEVRQFDASLVDKFHGQLVIPQPSGWPQQKWWISDKKQSLSEIILPENCLLVSYIVINRFSCQSQRSSIDGSIYRKTLEPTIFSGKETWYPWFRCFLKSTHWELKHVDCFARGSDICSNRRLQSNRSACALHQTFSPKLT